MTSVFRVFFPGRFCFEKKLTREDAEVIKAPPPPPLPPSLAHAAASAALPCRRRRLCFCPLPGRVCLGSYVTLSPPRLLPPPPSPLLPLLPPPPAPRAGLGHSIPAKEKKRRERLLPPPLLPSAAAVYSRASPFSTASAARAAATTAAFPGLLCYSRYPCSTTIFSSCNQTVLCIFSVFCFFRTKNVCANADEEASPPPV